MRETVFSKIVSGDLPCHLIWEDPDYMAFLDIYPPVKGMAVVIPRVWQSSNLCTIPKDPFVLLCAAAHHVAGILKVALNCERIVLAFEGLEVDHAHVKLYPVYRIDEGRKPTGPGTLDPYPAHLSTLAGPRADDHDLAALAQCIQETQ